jgi:glyoxylase-like metal-dependent hydrolase (beta-lactamase superfamily II)
VSIRIKTFRDIGPFMTNVYLLVEEEGRKGILVDPGIDCELIADAIQQEVSDLLWVVNTHCHLDHAAGNHLFAGGGKAKLAIHEDECEHLKHIVRQGLIWGISVRESPEPDLFLDESSTLKLGRAEVKIIHTPGHTPGGICLYFPGAAIVGDTLFAGSIGRTDLPGGETETLLNTIRTKLYALPDDTRVHPGHGPETTIGEEKLTNPFISI